MRAQNTRVLLDKMRTTDAHRTSNLQYKNLKAKMYVRVTLDIKISYEEANFIRETFIEKYNLRELALIPEQIDQAQQPTVEVQ